MRNPDLTRPDIDLRLAPSGSKFEAVVMKLAAKREVIYVPGKGKPIATVNPEGNFAERIEFLVAPRKPIYDYEGLEQFRLSLQLEDVKLGVDARARPSFSGSGMSYGYFAYDDELVSRRRAVVDDVEELEQGAAAGLGMQIGESHKEISDRLERRTLVHVLPHSLLADLVYGLKLDISILDEYRELRDLNHMISSSQLSALRELTENLGLKFALNNHPSLTGSDGLITLELARVARRELIESLGRKMD